MLRDTLNNLQTNKPWIKGLAFFGSRTIATERSLTSEKPSDVDMYIFYDGKEYKEKAHIGKLAFVDGRMQVVKQNPETTHLGNTRALEDFLLDLKKSRTQASLMNQEQVKDDEIPFRFTIDISQEATDKALEQLFNESISPVDFDYLIARFHLCVGKPVYANRNYILDILAKRPDGEQFFQQIMDRLQQFERLKKRQHAIAYTHLPKTIAEAREYFLTMPQGVRP